MRSLVAIPRLLLATVAAAEERPLYSAQDSLRRAQVLSEVRRRNPRYLLRRPSWHSTT